MPMFSIWATRLALIYFLLGFTFGALLLINKAVPVYPAIWGLLALHIEFLLMGWIVQLVFALGYWIFPRFRVEPKRGNPLPAWIALTLLNGGIIAVAANLQVFGRVLEVAAVLVFTAQLWLRTKPTETGTQIG
jgi:hypothetical protein